MYNQLEKFKAEDERSFLAAHHLMMNKLISESGKYRKKGVGIVKGDDIAHIAPPAANIPFLMKDLFDYLQNDAEATLIKSCVFHYEMEFIHPFLDGNGRMGRLWQTIILMQEYPVFEFLPFETMISESQQTYYEALTRSDKAGTSTLFIEYMLGIIDQSLSGLLNFNSRIFTDIDRLNYFINNGSKSFTRKEYMNVFKDISPATASRDLKRGIELNLLVKSGSQNQTLYSIK